MITSSFAGLLVLAAMIGTDSIAPPPGAAPVWDTARESLFLRASLAAEISGRLAAGASLGCLPGDPLPGSTEFEVVSEERPDTAVVRIFIDQPFSPRVRAPSLDELQAVDAWLRTCAGGDPGAAYGSGESPGTPLGLVAGLPSQVFAGVTEFVIERAFEQGTVGFILQMQEWFAEREGQELPPELRTVRLLFPRSVGIVERATVDNVASLVPTLQSAVRRDLDVLPIELASALPGGGAGERVSPVRVLPIIYRAIRDQRNGIPPILALEALLEIPVRDLRSPEIRRTVRALGFLAEDYSRVGEDVMAKVRASPEALTFLAAFLARDIHATLVDTSAGEWAEEDELAALLSRFDQARSSVSILVDDLSLLHRTFAAARTSLHVDSTQASLDPITPLLLRTFARAGGLVTLDPDRREALRTALEDVEEVVGQLAARDYPGVLSWLVRRPELALDGRALRYISFATTLATAENAEEVTHALRVAASPPTSYLSRRGQDQTSGPWTVGLTAILGGSIGAELTRIEGDGEWGGFGGLSLPIGLDVTWARDLGHLRGVSLFAPLIDLGPMASFRIGGDRVSSEPNLGWDQVFAPGILLIGSFTRLWPVSAGAGVQWVQELREVEGASVVEAADVVRFSLIFGVDVPLFQVRIREGLDTRTSRSR